MGLPKVPKQLAYAKTPSTILRFRLRLALWATVSFTSEIWCSNGVFMKSIFTSNCWEYARRGLWSGERIFCPVCDMLGVSLFQSVSKVSFRRGSVEIYHKWICYWKRRQTQHILLRSLSLKLALGQLIFFFENFRTQGRDHIWPFVHDFGGCLSAEQYGPYLLQRAP